jgi:glycosyltransferase involved in cell wall biosynthesis
MTLVSVIIPCYNEQATIRQLLEAIAGQTYPRPQLEVILADGRSSDATRQQIQAYAAAHPNLSIQLVDNPARTIPAGLNAAVRAAHGEIIVRLDGHAQPYPDYIQRAVDDLLAGLGENVGGAWEIQPGAPTRTARSIASAAAHPLGVGDALYRHADRAGLVDTVPFGAFRRTLLDQVGGFDETLLTNEDYEFNTRLRRSGGRIWLDPGIRSIYLARPTLGGLARQYARYGFWKARMLRRYPASLRTRQALPPLFVASLLLGTLLAVFLPLVRVLLGLELLFYLLVLLAAGIGAAARERRPFQAVGLPAAIAIMHLCWGAGFLWSMIKGIFPSRKHA